MFTKRGNIPSDRRVGEYVKGRHPIACQEKGRSMTIPDDARIKEEIDLISDSIDAIMKKIDSAMPDAAQEPQKDRPAPTGDKKNHLDDRAD